MKIYFRHPLTLYMIAISLGLLSGIYGNTIIHSSATLIADIFIRLFKCLGAPIIAISLITTLSSFNQAELSTTGKKTIIYTISTTVVAALVSMALYLFIQPHSTVITATAAANTQNTTYFSHLSNLIPSNFISPFIDNQVISILLIGIIIGLAIRQIPDANAQSVVKQFFKGLHSVLFVITKWVIAILPLGIYGFVTVSVTQYMNGFNIASLGQYFAVIVIANLLQGFIILPAWLALKGIRPFDTMKKMMPALTVAFFSKSSSGTLPLTMETAEKRLGLHPTISRLVLPLCTTVNMNGCAAFIFTTVIYVMQSNGIDISITTMLTWVVIATIAALGNAGVPMGCFFLSASLLTSMNVPIALLGIILPFYSVIDMVETALNVWSDSCVATVVNKDLHSSIASPVTEGVLETNSQVRI